MLTELNRINWPLFCPSCPPGGTERFNTIHLNPSIFYGCGVIAISVFCFFVGRNTRSIGNRKPKGPCHQRRLGEKGAETSYDPYPPGNPNGFPRLLGYVFLAFKLRVAAIPDAVARSSIGRSISASFSADQFHTKL